MKTALGIIIIGALAAGIILLSKGGGSETASVDNVKVTEGVQIISLIAKGGYQPRKTIAQAGVPTVLRFQTNGTFDCSLALRIPGENVSTFLPQSGTTDIDIGSQEPGTLNGLCSMGMYRFAVEFK